MVHYYNVIKLDKDNFLVCSTARRLLNSPKQKLVVGNIYSALGRMPSLKVTLDKMAFGEAAEFAFEEIGTLEFVESRKYSGKGFEVDYYNVRVVSASNATPTAKGLTKNVQGLAVLHVAIAECHLSGKAIERLPIDMTLADAKTLIGSFDSKVVHLQVVDVSGAVVYDNISKQTTEHTHVEKTTPATKVKMPRYDTMAQDNFYLSPQAKVVLSAIVNGIENGVFNNANLLLLGASGNGKTSLAYVLAKVLGWNLVKVSPANISEPEQFFGYVEMTNATTSYVHTEFSSGITTENTVVLIDELNRAHSSILGGIFNALDGTREVGVRGGKLNVAKNVIFVATMNVGPQYAGTFAVDWALMNRFNWRLEVGFLPFKEETEVLVRKTGVSQDDAVSIVMIAEKVRQKVDYVDMSVRTTLNIAYARKAGLPLRAAIEFAFIQGLDGETKKVLDDMVNREPNWGVFRPELSVVDNIF